LKFLTTSSSKSQLHHLSDHLDFGSPSTAAAATAALGGRPGNGHHLAVTARLQHGRHDTYDVISASAQPKIEDMPHQFSYMLIEDMPHQFSYMLIEDMPHQFSYMLFQFIFFCTCLKLHFIPIWVFSVRP
jgi:hypothetical protein